MATIREHFLKTRTANMKAANESAARTKVEPNAEQRRRMAKMKAMKKIRTRKFLIRTAIVAGVVILCLVGFFITYGIFNDVPFDKDDNTRKEIVITETSTKEEVAKQLEEMGCIADSGMFKTRCFVYDADFVPGIYRVSPSFTTEKIINILSGYDYSDGTMDENEVATTTQAEETTSQDNEEETAEEIDE